MCGECGRKFNTPSGLKQHSHVHKTDKPHVCEICDRKYTKRSNLSRHQRLTNCRTFLSRPKKQHGMASLTSDNAGPSLFVTSRKTAKQFTDKIPDLTNPALQCYQQMMFEYSLKHHSFQPLCFAALAQQTPSTNILQHFIPIWPQSVYQPLLIADGLLPEISTSLYFRPDTCLPKKEVDSAFSRTSTKQLSRAVKLEQVCETNRYAQNELNDTDIYGQPLRTLPCTYDDCQEKPLDLTVSSKAAHRSTRCITMSEHDVA